ncbi:MAG: hypothetical protein ACTH9L_05545, partial [Microbacterium gubbeenense]
MPPSGGGRHTRPCYRPRPMRALKCADPIRRASSRLAPHRDRLTGNVDAVARAARTRRGSMFGWTLHGT